MNYKTILLCVVLFSSCYVGNSPQAIDVSELTPSQRDSLTFAMQHGGLWVGMGIKASNTKAAQRSDMNYVGAFTGLHTTTPADASVDEVPQGDLDTARAFGQRVAQAAALLRKG